MNIEEVIQLHVAGNIAAAEQGYRQLIAGSAPPPEAFGNLGVICAGSGRLAEAVSFWEQAVEHKSDYVEAHFNMARAHQNSGNWSAARSSYKQVVQLAPEYSQAHYFLGKVCMELQEYAEAEACFSELLRREPGNFAIIVDLGLAQLNLGNYGEALGSFQAAIKLNPRDVAAYVNEGTAYLSLKDPENAERSFRKGLEVDPKSAVACHNLATVLSDRGRQDEAIAAYRKAIDLNPDLADAHNDLGNSLREVGRLADAAEAYQAALERRPGYLTALSNYVMNANYMHSPDQAELLEKAQLCGAAIPRIERDRVAHDFTTDRRLRVGYVSADFREHPVGYFMEGVLACHDPEKFEIFCYANQAEDDELTARLKDSVSNWRRVARISDLNFITQIEQDQIDILVDLSGHTSGTRLPAFAQKPAPVQLSWLGYFGTTGVDEIDYVIADRYVAPEGEEKYFSEKVWRLPHSYLCFTGPDVGVDNRQLPSLGNGHITFGCFNNRSKVTPETVALWSQLLAQVPGSHLLFKYRQYGNEKVQKELVSQFAEHGIDQERLEFEGKSPRMELLQSYARVDIALDPFPFGGGTTTAEALWMGVPVICTRGDRWVGRVSESILRAIGLEELVADDAEELISLVTELAANPARLGQLSASLRTRMENSHFCNGREFTADLEEAYSQMWIEKCANQRGVASA